MVFERIAHNNGSSHILFADFGALIDRWRAFLPLTEYITLASLDQALNNLGNIFVRTLTGILILTGFSVISVCASFSNSHTCMVFPLRLLGNALGWQTVHLWARSYQIHHFLPAWNDSRIIKHVFDLVLPGLTLYPWSLLTVNFSNGMIKWLVCLVYIWVH